MGDVIYGLVSFLGFMSNSLFSGLESFLFRFELEDFFLRKIIFFCREWDNILMVFFFFVGVLIMLLF